MRNMKRDDSETMKKTFNVIGVVFLLLSIWALFFITGISSFSLFPPDEPKYAYASYKMLESGDFITPVFNDEPRFDKPPLIYWLIAFSYRLFGVSDWAARVPSIISMLGVLIFIYLFCRKEFDRKTGILATLVFSSIFHVWIMARAVAPEAALVLFEVIALYCFYKGIREPNKIPIYLGYLFLSLAFLTKGPVGFIIPLGIVVIYFSFQKGIRDTLKRVLNPVGILIFAIVGFPWYIVMLKKYGYAYFQDFFLFHNLYRFSGAARQHPFKFYYYIPIFIGSLYLWLPFSQEIKDYVKGAFQNKSKEIFFVIWALFPLLFFSMSVNKLHNYILIAYPAAAIVVGDCLSKIGRVRILVKRLYFGAVVAEACLLIISFHYVEHSRGFFVVGISAILLTSVIIIRSAASMWRISILTMLKGFCILLLLVAFFGDDRRDIHGAYASIHYEADIEKEKVFFYRTRREDFCFYDNIAIPYLCNKAAVREILKRRDEIVLIINDDDLKDLRDTNNFRISSFADVFGQKKYSIIELRSFMTKP
jgi:4-amino-4-deoxy-L-arabinose transferase-like glycosyltransferase